MDLGLHLGMNTQKRNLQSIHTINMMYCRVGGLYICGDSADTQYMKTLKNIKNVTSCRIADHQKQGIKVGTIE